MYEGVDTVVLYEELAYEDVLPVGWRPVAAPLDAATLTSHNERNLHLLQVCAAIEEHGQPEKNEEVSPVATELLRLDLKVNLLLDLLGQLVVATHPRPAAVPMRFNAIGASWTPAAGQGDAAGQVGPAQGSDGVFEVYLREALPQPLRLAARITSVGSDGRIKVRFVPPPDTIADLIEKLAFRHHRRQIAGARQSRRG